MFPANRNFIDGHTVQPFFTLFVLLLVEIDHPENDDEGKNSKKKVMPVIKDKNSKSFNHRAL